MIEHVIITSFHTDNQSSGILPDLDWINHRKVLFEKYCLPSVAQQTLTDFTWLVLCSARSPRDLDSYFRSFQLPQLEVLRLEHPLTSSTLRDISCRKVDGSALLTTRVDSDDGLALDFVERLRASIHSETTRAYNFTRGLQVSEAGLLSVRNFGNPFISLLEGPEVDRPRTIYGFEHPEVHREFEVRQIGGAPAWLQVVHDRNVGNRTGGVPTRVSAHHNDFVGLSATPKFSPLKYWRLARPDRVLSRRIAARVSKRA